MAWGLLVVGLIDNVVKPLFIKGGVEMHGAVVFFALLGGLAAFGPVGLIAGPLVVAFFIAITRASGGAEARSRLNHSTEARNARSSAVTASGASMGDM